jgi:hypothetical protein
MARAWEPDFIRLWQAGASQAAIAQALGVPVGTVKSRAHHLAAQGKIQPRPRGGAYPRRTAHARVEQTGVSADTPHDTPAHARRVPADTPPVQYLPPSQGEMLPLLTDILQELRQLTSRLAARVSTDTPGVHRDTPRVSAGVSGRIPLPTERGPSVRWNLHLSERLRERLKAMAATRGLQDSQLVEELLWRALSMVEESSDGLTR